MRDSEGDQAAALRTELDQAKKDLKDTEHRLTSRHEHVAILAPQLDATKKELEKLRARFGEVEQQLKEAAAEVSTARGARDAAEEALRKLRSELAQAQKLIGKSDEFERKVEARDRQIDVAQQQIADLKEEIKVEEEERTRATNHLAEARESERVAMERVEALEAEAGVLRKRADEAEQSNELQGEVDKLTAALTDRADDNRALQGQLESTRKELEKLLAEQEEMAELERKHTEAAAELVRVGGALTNAETAAERARDEVAALREKLEQAAERRHDAEKQLVESRAKLDSEHHIREQQGQRIKQLEDALQREREAVDSSAPAGALESLSAQLATEREKWERIDGEKDREVAEMRKRVAAAELRENELSSQLESVELSQQDVMRAKAVAGQRRAQIERMQADVEGARRRAEEAETYWKAEIDDFRQAVADHLEAAERGDPDADQRMQKLLEDLKVGMADKYAKLRRRNNKVEKELQETQDKLTAIERILARREEEEARLRKIIEELERRERVPGAKKAEAKRPAPKSNGKKKK